MATLSSATFRETGITHADTLETPAANAASSHGRARPEISSVSPNPAQARVIAGKYRLEEQLGEGGMGTIWRALNLQLELPVAIKLLRPGFESAELAERLRSEARLVAGLVHPSIVRVFDAGESEAGEPFIVMELLRGESLAQMLTRGPLSPIDAVRLLLPIAEALAVAHARGIVHRDIKPDNVFVTSEGLLAVPKLLDFGIARVEGADTGARRKLTLPGSLLGSPDYMSPEQAAGDPDVDCRSDIWSFCVTLYEALAGLPPFTAPTLRTLRRSIAEHTPPALERAGVDAVLASIVSQGLEKDPERRPASIRQLGRALASWLVEQGVECDAARSSLSAKWLEAGETVGQPRASSAITTRPIEREEPVTLAPEGVHQPYVRRRHSWRTALGAPVAAAALIALAGGFVVGNSALVGSSASGTAQVATTEPLRDSEPACPTPAATAAVALAPPGTSCEIFAYSVARFENAVRTPAATFKPAGAARSSPAIESRARAELPF